MRTLIALSLLLAVVVGCAGIAPSPEPSSPTPSPTPSLGPQSSPTAEPPAGIDIAVKVRDALGMRSDRAWVETVQQDPTSVLSNLGILVSADELAQLQQ